MSRSRDPAQHQGCLGLGPHGPTLPLPFLFPVVSLTPSPGLVTAGGPWANLRFVLSLSLPQSLFLPGSDALRPSCPGYSHKMENTVRTVLVPSLSC